MFAFKLNIMAQKVIEKTIGEKWREVMVSRGTKQTWVAEQVGISPEHFSNILADRVLITEENEKKINAVLETNFTQNGTAKA